MAWASGDVFGLARISAVSPAGLTCGGATDAIPGSPWSVAATPSAAAAGATTTNGPFEPAPKCAVIRSKA